MTGISKEYDGINLIVDLGKAARPQKTVVCKTKLKYVLSVCENRVDGGEAHVYLICMCTAAKAHILSEPYELSPVYRNLIANTFGRLNSVKRLHLCWHSSGSYSLHVRQ